MVRHYSEGDPGNLRITSRSRSHSFGGSFHCPKLFAMRTTERTKQASGRTRSLGTSISVCCRPWTRTRSCWRLLIRPAVEWSRAGLALYSDEWITQRSWRRRPGRCIQIACGNSTCSAHSAGDNGRPSVMGPAETAHCARDLWWPRYKERQESTHEPMAPTAPALCSMPIRQGLVSPHPSTDRP